MTSNMPRDRNDKRSGSKRRAQNTRLEQSRGRGEAEGELETRDSTSCHWGGDKLKNESSYAQIESLHRDGVERRESFRHHY